MGHTGKYMPTYSNNHSQSNELTTIQAYIKLLSKLSYICNRRNNTCLSNQEEETMVGYESSWAGISKDTKIK